MTKTNTRSRIVSILLVLVMLLTMVPINAVTANAAEWTTVNSYEQFEAAMTAEGQRSIKLGSDIDTGTLNSGMGLLDTLAVKGQKQLDLNGHTLRLFTQKSALGDLIKVENSSLTLSDSSAAQNRTHTRRHERRRRCSHQCVGKRQVHDEQRKAGGRSIYRITPRCSVEKDDRLPLWRRGCHQRRYALCSAEDIRRQQRIHDPIL